MRGECDVIHLAMQILPGRCPKSSDERLYHAVDVLVGVGADDDEIDEGKCDEAVDH